MRITTKPVLCNYYLTYRCNAQCGFCDIWEKPSPYIQLEDVKQNLIALKKLGVKVIDFTGGEPLLHQQLHEFLALAKEMKFITTVTTNGLLYPKRAEQLKGLIDMLHFSLDTDDKAKHDTMRGVACFDHVMESIKVAKSLGERPDILFTVFDENIKDLEGVYNNIALPNDLVLIINPAFSYNSIEEELSPKSLKTLKKWSGKKNVYLNKAFLSLRENGGNHVNDPVCLAGTTTLVINPENELVLPCYHLGQSKFKIENNLEKLYRSTEVQAVIAQEGRLPECEGCTINCYMQPSFSVQMNKYWFQALPSTIKYNRMKGTWKQLL